MAFDFLPVHSFYSSRFIVPSYQRGYRWDTKQVTDLLRDLNDFLESNPADNESYCLQPLVVQPTGEPHEYILIDGQQRLTTIFLILSYIDGLTKGSDKPLDLTFEKRPLQQKYLDEFGFADPDDKSYTRNIDTFYMQRAYHTIKEWFESFGDKERADVISSVRTLLTAPNEGAKERACVKIIWYELPGDNPMEAFDRLNYRRIRLTGTELVKAMLLASNMTDSTDKNSVNRAHRWDEMEKQLREPSFRSMFSTDRDRLGHIDFILDMVADDINSVFKTNEKINRKNDAELFNYHVIDGYFRQNRSKMSREEIVEDVWSRITTTFNRVRNLYDNPLWYHYTGLWCRLGSGNIISEVVKLDKKFAGKSKHDFTEELRKKAGSILKSITLSLLNEQEKIQHIHPLQSEKLNYNDNPGAIRKILLAVNVMTTASDPTAGRFPFHIYDLYNVTSLEHIHPQNITFDMTFADIKEWAGNRISALRIEKNLPEDVTEACKILENEFKNPVWDETHKAGDGDVWNRVRDSIAVIDRQFGDMAEISGKELDAIGNMALVDVATNAALSNNYLNVKREKLIERDKLRRTRAKERNRFESYTATSDETYLMPATERVFSKYYTADSPGDMRLWRPEDRTAYLNVITRIYDTLTAE